jgi:cyclopropane fatty-acyl-phospholipid synthase-like methyltransferase
MTLGAALVLAAILGATLTLISILWPTRFGAPWLPSSRRDIRGMLALAGVEPDEVVYDLGSGDGRVLITAARDFDARAVGIEIDPLRMAWSRLRVRMLGLGDRVTVIWGNLFNEDVSDADVVVVFLRQDTNVKLLRKLQRELRPGARVVSNTFVFPGWKTAAIDREAHLFLYRIPPAI